MSEYHIIKKGYFYLHDYSENDNVQTNPTWDFSWVGCLLFERNYGLKVAENVKGTLYEIEGPNRRESWNYQVKIGVIVRSFE